jgi:hypothetical protein
MHYIFMICEHLAWHKMSCVLSRSFLCQKTFNISAVSLTVSIDTKLLFPIALFPFLKHIQRVCNSKGYGNIPLIHTCILCMVLWVMDMQLLLEQKLKVKGMLFSDKLWSRRQAMQKCNCISSSTYRTVFSFSFKWEHRFQHIVGEPTRLCGLSHMKLRNAVVHSAYSWFQAKYWKFYWLEETFLFYILSVLVVWQQTKVIIKYRLKSHAKFLFWDF